MSAATAARPIPDIKGDHKIVAHPIVANGIVYAGQLAIVSSDGYLNNLTSTNYKNAKKIVIPIESYDNTGGANGSISGDNQDGVRTVRCIEGAIIKLSGGSGLAQADIGMPVYAHNNNDYDTVQLSGVKIGTVEQYLGSATEAFIKLESDVLEDGIYQIKVPLTAAGDGTAGAVLSMVNPLGEDLIIDSLVLDITTAPTDTAAGLDAGIAANGTTSNDALIDGAVLAAAGQFTNIKNAGTNGGQRKWGSAQYLTITSVVGAHLDLAAMVGNAIIRARIF